MREDHVLIGLVVVFCIRDIRLGFGRLLLRQASSERKCQVALKWWLLDTDQPTPPHVFAQEEEERGDQLPVGHWPLGGQVD